MHGISSKINLGKYLLITTLLEVFFYNRDFDNRAMGLLGASNGHSVTALWLLSWKLSTTWAYHLSLPAEIHHLRGGVKQSRNSSPD